MAVQGSRRRLAQMMQRRIVVWRGQHASGKGTDGASDAQVLALSVAEYVSTWWALLRELGRVGYQKFMTAVSKDRNSRT